MAGYHLIYLPDFTSVRVPMGIPSSLLSYISRGVWGHDSIPSMHWNIGIVHDISIAGQWSLHQNALDDIYNWNTTISFKYLKTSIYNIKHYHHFPIDARILYLPKKEKWYLLNSLYAATVHDVSEASLNIHGCQRSLSVWKIAWHIYEHSYNVIHNLFKSDHCWWIIYWKEFYHIA